jgi:hypothetical protein
MIESQPGLGTARTRHHRRCQRHLITSIDLTSGLQLQNALGFGIPPHAYAGLARTELLKLILQLGYLGLLLFDGLESRE